VHEILRAHEQPYGAIGGAVEKAAPDSALNWSLYLVDYVRYANPISAGVVHHLTDCNVSYKRSALTQIEGVWRKEFHEPEVHASLEAAGHDLSFSPRIVVRQQRSMGFREAIRDRYEFGRLFGGRRAAGVALSRRLSYIMASFFLPVLLTGRVAVHVLRRKRYMGAFLRALPFALLLNTTWAWGEFIGYLTRQAGRSLKLDQEA
jgi:hypothetical protein